MILDVKTSVPNPPYNYYKLKFKTKIPNFNRIPEYKRKKGWWVPANVKKEASPKPGYTRFVLNSSYENYIYLPKVTDAIVKVKKRADEPGTIKKNVTIHGWKVRVISRPHWHDV